MKTIATFIFACVLLAAMPSCKKCYTCTIPSQYNCIVGSSVYDTYPSNNATYTTECQQAGGLLVLGTAGSSTKHCYNTSGPVGGALNGQASAESSDEDNCYNNGGTWASN